MRRNPQTLMAQIASEDGLHLAWRQVRANQGAPGADEVTLSSFEERLEERLAELARRLREDEYLPAPLRRTSIPRRDGGLRGLAIPTVADRIAQRACVNALEPLFEAQFLDCSWAYRPGRGVDGAVESVLTHRQAGYGWVVDADIAHFFDSLNHALLLEQLRLRISDRAVLRLIQLWLASGALAAPPPEGLTRLRSAGRYVREVGQDTVDHLLGRDFASAPPVGEADEDGSPAARRLGRDALLLACTFRHVLTPLLTTPALAVGGGLGAAALGAVALRHMGQRRLPGATGTPQGSPLSPLLANVYLHPFDQALTRRRLRLVRYADDFVICCGSAERARQALQAARETLTGLRLALHDGKTRVVAEGEMFEFLGRTFDREGAFVTPRPERAEMARAALKQAGQRGRAVAQDVQARWEENRPWRRKGCA